jgi:phosphatidylserine/phosphatidylglycerophosphate/cardiolipin synthase-like enzyme
MRSLPTVAALVVALVLAACSGSTSDPASATPSPSVPAASSAASSAAASSAAPGGPTDDPASDPAYDRKAKGTKRSGCNVNAGYEVCFSSPATKGGSDASVVKRFIELFNEAGEGDSLRMAMFRWDIPATTTALLGAVRRGAHVELVADADVTTKQAGQQLIAGLRAAGSTVVVCDGSCLPWRGNGPPPPSQNVNHLKLLLADIGGQQSVVTSSSNFEGRQYSQYNSLARITDAGYYAFASSYFDRLKAQSWTVGGATWKDKQRGYAGPPPAMVYPRKGDLVVNTLRQTQCVPGARSVDIMVAVLQRYDVRTQIGRLAKAGCKIRIVTTRDLIENWLQKPFKLPNGTTVDLPDNNVRTIITHDKVYAIHARIAGKVQYAVVTGTSNTTCGGLLYNDEIMLKLSGKWAYQTYRAHVLDAFQHAHQSRTSAVPVQARCS